MSKTNPYLGKWHIVEMELWDQEFIDMETDGFFLLEKDSLGSFQFGLVQGRIDYRIETIGEIKRLEFSWEGQDENDEALGRGWAYPLLRLSTWECLTSVTGSIPTMPSADFCRAVRRNYSRLSPEGHPADLPG